MPLVYTQNVKSTMRYDVDVMMKKKKINDEGKKQFMKFSNRSKKQKKRRERKKEKQHVLVICMKLHTSIHKHTHMA